MTGEILKSIRKKLKLTQSQVAFRLGLTLRTVQNYESGFDIPLHVQKLINYELVDDLNRIHSVEEPASEYLPLVPYDALGNRAFSPSNEVDKKYFVPDFKTADFLLTVKGDDMTPTYEAGDIIACKSLNKSSIFQWGKAYVLKHKEGNVIIKRLFSTSDDSVLECRSDNEKYPPFKVDKKDIAHFALVVGAIHVE